MAPTIAPSTQNTGEEFKGQVHLIEDVVYGDKEVAAIVDEHPVFYIKNNRVGTIFNAEKIRTTASTQAGAAKMTCDKHVENLNTLFGNYSRWNQIQLW